MKTILFLVLFILIAEANEGVELGKTTRDYFKNNIDSTIAQPLTSNKEFVTIDGKKNFKANLTCTDDSTHSFLTVSYSGNSDINLNINIDTDLNGDKETSYNFSGISGISANGVVKCEPNTWQNCKYYLWNLTNNQLSLKEATRYDLAGTYCINASCGNLAMNQKSDILNTLGGTISNLYQASSSQYLVTKTENTGSLINFFGQNFKDCTNLKDKGNTPAFNVTDDSGMDYSSEVLKQSADPLSPYSVLNDNINNQNNHISSKVCTILNKVSLESKTINKSLNANGGAMCLDHYFEGRLNYDETTRHLTMDIAGSSPNRVIGQNCGGAGWNRIINIDVSTLGINFDTEIADIKADVKTHVWGGGCPNSTQSAHFTNFANDRIILNSACSASGAQNPSWAIDLILTITSEKLLHTQDDTCKKYSSDEECKIKTEKKYDTKNTFVYTVRNFNNTGITLEKSFNTITGVKLWNVGYGKGSIDYFVSGGSNGFLYSGENSEFKTEREYHCSTDLNYDYSDVKRVNNSVKKSVNSTDENGGHSFSYTAEQKNKEGVWTSKSEDGFVNFSFESSEQKFCKVQYLVDNTLIMSDGETKASSTGEQTTYKVEARECTGEHYDICPYDSAKGEVIRSQCGDNDFGRVTALLSGIDEAAKDIICSED